MSLNGIQTLSKEDVIEIHDRLTLDALNSEDPISPPGIKSEELLESAIARQYVGYSGKLKYGTALSNAATLCYGICCNHALHNGNKRTALVTLLCHLDKNDLTFKDNVNQNLLYIFMLNIAGHTLVPKKQAKGKNDQSDLEITEMTNWLQKKTRKFEKGERNLSYHEFEKALREFDVFFENHKGNYIDVIKYTTKTKLITRQKYRVGEKVANIPYFPGRIIGKNLIKSVREKAGLTYKDGVDSALFYGTQSPPDEFIAKYRKTLQKLAKT